MIDYGEKNLEKEIALVFEEQYKKLFGMVYRMTENIQDTEDILQNVFIKAYSNIKKFRGDSELSTWLYRITVNEGNGYLKSWKKLPVTQLSKELGLTEKEFFESIEYIRNQDDKLIIEEMREKCLRGFLRCIPQKMRVCFLLKTCLELKNKEIAKVLNLTVLLLTHNVQQ